MSFELGELGELGEEILGSTAFSPTVRGFVEVKEDANTALRYNALAKRSNMVKQYRGWKV